MRKNNKKIITVFSIILFFFVLFCITGQTALGQDTNTSGVELPTGTPPPKISLENPISETSVPVIIGNIVKTILTIVGALALGMFIYGGFTWLTSGGSSEKIQKGKNILMWATIGLIVIFASYTLVDFLLKAFGL